MNDRDLEVGVMGQQVSVEDMVWLAPSEIVEKEQMQARKTLGKHMLKMLIELMWIWKNYFDDRRTRKCSSCCSSVKARKCKWKCWISCTYWWRWHNHWTSLVIIYYPTHWCTPKSLVRPKRDPTVSNCGSSLGLGAAPSFQH